MDSNKMNLIFDRLLQRTQEEKIEWEKTADVNTYLVVLEDSSISMTYLPSIDAFTFQFRNENGDVVVSVNVDDTVAPQAYRIFHLATQRLQKTENTNKFVDSILEQLAA